MDEFPFSFFEHPTFLVVREVKHQADNIKMLLAAIIRRAAYDIALYRDDKRLVNRRLAIQAGKWMFDDRDVMLQHPKDRFTAFLNICDMLDQDPKWIRAKTLELRASDVKKYDRVGSF